jgi:prepilin-type N-terminal cleavage/methylation domain-containing protein
MKGPKGFTLIEMAVVLAIIAILAAILTPLVTSYIDQARTSRAATDVSSIAKAYILHYRDTSYWPVFKSGDQAGGNPTKNCQVSGNSTTLPTGSNHASWTTSTLTCTSGNVGMIAQYLNLNTLGMTTGNPSGGGIAYRGPYLDGLNANDPWNQPYVVTSRHLSTNDQSRWAVAISGGPNAGLDSDGSQLKSAGPFVSSSDDLVALIR